MTAKNDDWGLNYDDVTGNVKVSKELEAKVGSDISPWKRNNKIVLNDSKNSDSLVISSDNDDLGSTLFSSDTKKSICPFGIACGHYGTVTSIVYFKTKTNKLIYYFEL